MIFSDFIFTSGLIKVTSSFDFIDNSFFFKETSSFTIGFGI